jgi:hypothetical protein
VERFTVIEIYNLPVGFSRFAGVDRRIRWWFLIETYSAAIDTTRSTLNFCAAVHSGTSQSVFCLPFFLLFFLNSWASQSASLSERPLAPQSASRRSSRRRRRRRRDTQRRRRTRRLTTQREPLPFFFSPCLAISATSRAPLGSTAAKIHGDQKVRR